MKKTILLLIVTFTTCLGVFAQTAELAPFDVSPFEPFVQALVGKYGWMVQVLLIVGFLRFIVKPIIAGLHWYAEQTETPKDNELLAKIENSKSLKVFLFALDWLASFKVRK